MVISFRCSIFADIHVSNVTYLNKNMTEKKCINCGKEIHNKRENTKFCSGKCRTANFHKNNSKQNKIEQQLSVINEKLDLILKKSNINTLHKIQNSHI